MEKILFEVNGFDARKGDKRGEYLVCVSKRGASVSIIMEAYADASLAVARAEYLAKNSDSERLFDKFEREIIA